MDRTVAIRFSVLRRHGHRPRQRPDRRAAYRDKAPYPFTGTVKKVVFDLKPGRHEDEKALHADAERTAGAAALSG